MKLSEAVNTCFETRDAWREGSGSSTARINVNHVMRIIGDVEIEDIRTSHFAKIALVLKQEGKANGTINRITAALSTVLGEMKALGYELPDVHFKRQKEKRGRPGFFTEDEIDSLLEAAKNEPDYMLLHDSIMFGIKTGCRQGEMLELLDSDIDWENQEVLFRNTKNGKDHAIKIHDDLIPILKRRDEARIGPYIFPWRDKDQLLRAFKRMKQACGMKPSDDRVWHHLRHTTATWLCERGVPLRAVMGVLNHTRVETTLRYSKASSRSVAAAIDLL
jgi:integrase